MLQPPGILNSPNPKKFLYLPKQNSTISPPKPLSPKKNMKPKSRDSPVLEMKTYLENARAY
jgi:hypothetical protein